MQSAIEDLFLAYVNLDFETNTKNLIKFLNLAEKLISFDDHFDSVGAVLSYVEAFNKYEKDEHEDIELFEDKGDCLEKLNIKGLVALDENEYDDNDTFATAFESTFGYPQNCGFCHPIDIEKRETVLTNLFKKIGPKCFFCDQKLFIYILSCIIKRENSLIAKTSLDNLFMGAYSNFGYEIKMIPEKIPLTDSDPEIMFPFKTLKKIDKWKSYIIDEYTGFKNLLIDLAAYSLSEFLLNNDVRKLKQCCECKKFYVSKSVRPSKFCSNKCRGNYHNRIRIQSGAAREYKRKKRMEGAKESYYG